MITVSPFTGGKVTLHKEVDTVKYRGEEYTYIRYFYECDDTHTHFTDNEIDWMSVSQVYNQYRAKHGIPSTEEIQATREKYGLSKRRMSKILDIAPTRYQDYELGNVPSEADGIKLKSIADPNVFKNYLAASRSKFSADEYAKILAIVNKHSGMIIDKPTSSNI